MSIKMLLRVGLAAALATGATVVAMAGTAQAAEPHCNGYASKPLLTAGYYGPWIPVYNGDVHCRLDMGDGVGGKNWGVVALQRNLNRCYQERFAHQTWDPDLRFDPLVEDGQFGQKTKDALINAQKYINRVDPGPNPDILTDGGYGPQTRQWLEFTDGTTNFGYYYPNCDWMANPV